MEVKEQPVNKEKMPSCHEKAADHFEKAAELHRKAMKHCADSKDEAMIASLKAMGHTICGLKHAKMLAEHCACDGE